MGFARDVLVPFISLVYGSFVSGEKIFTLLSFDFSPTPLFGRVKGMKLKRTGKS
jgi:hypothetical protein